MYDDLSTLMREATLKLSPPPAAASRALRVAAKSRKRSAYLAGTGGVAAVAALSAGAAAVSARRGPQIAHVAAQAPVLLCPPDQQAVDRVFRALALPDKLPGFPINLWPHPVADSFQTGTQNNTVNVGPGDRTIVTHIRLFGWDAAPYIRDAHQPPGIGKGGAYHPGGPQLRLSIAEKPGAYSPRADGRIQDRRVDGRIAVRGQSAFVSHDSDSTYVSLSYCGFSIEADGGSGATVADLVMSIEAIEGLDATDVSTQPTMSTSGTSQPSPTASPNTVTSS